VLVHDTAFGKSLLKNTEDYFEHHIKKIVLPVSLCVLYAIKRWEIKKVFVVSCTFNTLTQNF